MPELDDELPALIAPALDGDTAALEMFLTTHSRLPGPRMNIELVTAFADALTAAVAHSADAPATQTGTDALRERALALLAGWAGLTLANAPVNHPREVLPAAAALAHGALAEALPAVWDAVIARLQTAANSPRWRTREVVAAAVGRLLARDWRRTCDRLITWATGGTPLEMRAAAAAVAEPALLTDQARCDDALAIQAAAVDGFLHIPDGRRRDEDARALRQALGYTLSVVTAATPHTGFHLMEELAALPDEDVVWIIRENIRKRRLSRYQDRLDTLETALFRPE